MSEVKVTLNKEEKVILDNHVLVANLLQDLTRLSGTRRSERCPFRVCKQVLSFFTVEQIVPHMGRLNSLGKGLECTAPEFVNDAYWCRLSEIFDDMALSLTLEKRNIVRLLFNDNIKMVVNDQNDKSSSSLLQREPCCFSLFERGFVAVAAISLTFFFLIA